MPVNFFSEEISFTLPKAGKHIQWINKIIKMENKSPGEINVIFCTDSYLHSINHLYLGHDSFTDIITFEYTERAISGDLFISIERVRENADSLQSSFGDELDRVIIHGILHLLGFNDKSKKDKTLIRKKEDHCLSLRTF